MTVLSGVLGSMLFAAAPAAGPPAPAVVSPYGVCAHIARGDERPYAERELPLMRQAGVGWVRTDFSWAGVERRPGEWSLNHLAEITALARREGVRILPILDYDVPWARPAHRHLDLWLEYVRRVVSLCRRDIRYWEVWNEPNLEHFWKDKPDPADYVKLLKATYAEIKRIDPELQVVLGGVSGMPWTYLEGIYDAGGGPFFDVMNVHPYRYPASPEERSLYEDLTKLRERMRARGDGAKPIWITEIGWPTHQGRRGVSEERQAAMLARAYLLAMQAGVQVVFWYEFQAMEGRPDDNEHHFGIVHRELEPKPAYHALRALAQARPAGSRLAPGPWRTGDVYHLSWIRPDGRRAWAVWAPGGPRACALRVDGALRAATNHLGQPVSVAVVDGRATVLAGDGPLYLIGPGTLRLAP